MVDQLAETSPQRTYQGIRGARLVEIYWAKHNLDDLLRTRGPVVGLDEAFGYYQDLTGITPEFKRRIEAAYNTAHRFDRARMSHGGNVLGFYEDNSKYLGAFARAAKLSDLERRRISRAASRYARAQLTTPSA